ncbi:hypothetical protein KAM622c_57840 (plasmid) [Klebsiella quasipneumoniae subsp. quasipneumoniae]|nr:hypothetical protein KAM622c_57840 [Klebsiella quasipneumoniae subsp. quasipneumoniae]
MAVKNPVITDSVKSGEPAHMFLSMNSMKENKAESESLIKTPIITESESLIKTPIIT